MNGPRLCRPRPAAALPILRPLRLVEATQPRSGSGLDAGNFVLGKSFKVGYRFPRGQSPEGTADNPACQWDESCGFSRPFGTRTFRTRGPNTEVLGYYRFSLREKDI